MNFQNTCLVRVYFAFTMNFRSNNVDFHNESSNRLSTTYLTNDYLLVVSVFLSRKRWQTHYFVSWTTLYRKLILCKHILLKLNLSEHRHRSRKNANLRLSIHHEFESLVLHLNKCHHVHPLRLALPRDYRFSHNVNSANAPCPFHVERHPQLRTLHKVTLTRAP